MTAADTRLSALMVELLGGTAISPVRCIGRDRMLRIGAPGTGLLDVEPGSELSHDMTRLMDEAGGDAFALLNEAAPDCSPVPGEREIAAIRGLAVRHKPWPGEALCEMIARPLWPELALRRPSRPASFVLIDSIREATWAVWLTDRPIALQNWEERRRAAAIGARLRRAFDADPVSGRPDVLLPLAGSTVLNDGAGRLLGSVALVLTCAPGETVVRHGSTLDDLDALVTALEQPYSLETPEDVTGGLALDAALGARCEASGVPYPARVEG